MTFKIDDGLVHHIADTLSYNPAEIKKSIEANSQNSHTTTYKLLMKKWLLNGKDSPFDIHSEKFDPELLKKPQVRSGMLSSYTRIDGPYQEQVSSGQE
jgi:hypothetical protein